MLPLALAPRLLGRLELRLLLWGVRELDNLSLPWEASQEEQQQQQHAAQAAHVVGRLGAQLARCSGLQQLSVGCWSIQRSLQLAADVLLAPRLQRLLQLEVFKPQIVDKTRKPRATQARYVLPRHGQDYYPDAARQLAAAAALAAALTARHRGRPEADASRALHVTTNLLTKQGAEDVMRALDAVGAQGVRVERLATMCMPS